MKWRTKYQRELDLSKAPPKKIFLWLPVFLEDEKKEAWLCFAYKSRMISTHRGYYAWWEYYSK